MSKGGFLTIFRDGNPYQLIGTIFTIALVLLQGYAKTKVTEIQKIPTFLPSRAMAEKKEKPPIDPNQAKKAVKEMLSTKSSAGLAKQIKSSLTKKGPEDVYHTIQFAEDIPMRLHAEIARTELPLRKILSWKNGSVIRFDKIIGEPLDLLIGEQLIARGEVVVVNDRFGIRISEIARPDDKVGETRQ